MVYSHRILPRFLFVCFAFIWNFQDLVQGKHCSSYTPLDIAELKRGNCQQMNDSSFQYWLKIDCKIRRFYWYPDHDFRQCIQSWCHYFATCFHQTTEWENTCNLKFKRFQLSYFDISTAEGVNDISHFKQIYVKYCGKPRYERTYYYRTFAIRISFVECQSKNTGKEPPCLKTAVWKHGSNTCNHLNNSTNNIWYEVGRGYYSSLRWCDAFRDCFGFTDVRKRCRLDFDFYFRAPPKFTTEILSYLPYARIQVSYVCSKRYTFAVNVIRCNSGSKLNDGLEIKSDNDASDDDADTPQTLNDQVLNDLSLITIEREDSLQIALGVFEETMFGNLTEEAKMEEVFQATTAFEEFALEYARYHLNQTNPKLNISSQNIDLEIRRVFDQNESNFYLKESKGQNFVKIPSENFQNDSEIVLGVLYKTLHKLLVTNDVHTKDATNESRHLNTIIMSATIDPHPTRLTENVTLMFRDLKITNMKRDCVFWNTAESSYVGWSGQGCSAKSVGDSQTECTCNHLTHFAVLVQFGTGPGDKVLSETDNKILEVLTYLGLTLSLIGIILTILSYAFLTEMKGPLSQIRLSLVASLGAAQIIFLAGIGATENKKACVLVAALEQYFLFAAFCWMFIEGVYLYLFVVKVYNVSSKLKICHGVAWSFSALVVALSLSITASKDGIECFVSEKLCWLSSENGLIWIFIVFVLLIGLLNVMILLRVIKEMTTMHQTKDSQSEKIRLGIRACLVMIPLLGVTWLFGVLSSVHKAFAYIFTIFNSTQGFMIFFLHCVRNTEIRSRFKRKLHSIFPLADNGTNIKRSSEGNETASGNISIKKTIAKHSVVTERRNDGSEKTSCL